MEDTETVRFSHLHPDEYLLARNGNYKRSKRPDPKRKISFKEPPWQEILPDFVNPDTSVSVVASSNSSISVKKPFYKFNLPVVSNIDTAVLLPPLVSQKQDAGDPGSQKR